MGEEVYPKCKESAEKKGIVVQVGPPGELSVIAGEAKVSAKAGKNIRLYAMTSRFPARCRAVSTRVDCLRRRLT